MSNEFSVVVVYALPYQQTMLEVRISPEATVSQAIELSGILKKFPELDLADLKVGIYGKATKLDAGLHDKDRIEIYRPLIADPREVRKRRVVDGGTPKKEQAAGAA